MMRAFRTPTQLVCAPGRKAELATNSMRMRGLNFHRCARIGACAASQLVRVGRVAHTHKYCKRNMLRSLISSGADDSFQGPDQSLQGGGSTFCHEDQLRPGAHPTNPRYNRATAWCRTAETPVAFRIGSGGKQSCMCVPTLVGPGSSVLATPSTVAHPIATRAATRRVSAEQGTRTVISQACSDITASLVPLLRTLL